jgi:hypothetical protein
VQQSSPAVRQTVTRTCCRKSWLFTYRPRSFSVYNIKQERWSVCVAVVLSYPLDVNSKAVKNKDFQNQNEMVRTFHYITLHYITSHDIALHTHKTYCYAFHASMV